VSAKAADDVVDSFASENSANVINLQYHMDSPGNDPMNENNPIPPRNRAGKVGVPGDPPYAVLNWGMEMDQRYDFSDPVDEPFQTALKRASLEIPLFELDIDIDWMENSMEANVLVTCLADTFTSNLQLYVVLIETSVTAYTGENQDTVFRNVVLDMLPTPAGKLLGNEWNNGKTVSRSYTWDYPGYVEDIEDLAVVAFVQNRDLDPIVQATANYFTPQVGFTPKHTEPGSLLIYPNPARAYVFIRTGQNQTGAGKIKIADLSGKEVMTTEIQPENNIQRLDISLLSEGIYMIYWIDSGVLKGRNKLVRIR
jgi:hypothetical protein